MNAPPGPHAAPPTADEPGTPVEGGRAGARGRAAGTAFGSAAASALLLQAFAHAQALALAFVLARALGAQGFGEVSVALAIAALAVIPALGGINQVAVREAARAIVSADSASLVGLRAWALRRVAALSILSAAAVIAIGLVARLAPWPVIAAAALLVALTAVAEVLAGLLRGLQHIRAGLAGTQLVRPTVALGAVLLLWGTDRLTTVSAMAAVVTGVGAGLLYSWAALVRAWPEAARGVTGRGAPSWSRSAWALALVAGMYALQANTDIVMVGWLRGTTEAGIYTVGSRIAAVTTFVLVATQPVLAPLVAAAAADRDAAEVSRLMALSARIMAAFALAVALPLLVFRHPLLGLFGEAFTDAAPVLVILASAQATTMLFGSPGVLLSMVQHEATTARWMVVGASLNVALNAALVPTWGALGAAIATGASLVLWKGGLAWRARSLLGIDPSVLGRPPVAASAWSAPENAEKPGEVRAP